MREKEALLPPPKTVSELAKERKADPNDEPEPRGLKVDVSKLDLSKTMVGDIWNPKSRAGPARTVHIDFSPHGARQNISNKRMDILEEARDIIVAEDVAIAAGLSYEGRRYGIYSVWRPLKTAKRDPLIMCDPNSIEVKRDLVESMNKSPGVKGDFLNGLYMMRPGMRRSRSGTILGSESLMRCFSCSSLIVMPSRKGDRWVCRMEVPS